MLCTSVYFTVLATSVSTVAARTFTVQNNCAYTVWPALTSSSTVVPSTESGWAAAAGSVKTIAVPDGWSGRIWGRTGCTFSGASSSCVTGSCAGGGLLCNGTTLGAPPASTAEWVLDASGQDWYWVSLEHGANIPLAIASPGTVCPTASCPVDLNAACPTSLVVKDASGNSVGCNSACDASGGSDESSCCTGAHALPSTCPASGVKEYAFFKNRCPKAFVFKYDESSTSLPGSWSCSASSTKYDYSLTFCP